MIALADYCVADINGSYETECLIEYQAVVAESQQWPAEFTQALPYIGLFVVFGFGLLLGRGR